MNFNDKWNIIPIKKKKKIPEIKWLDYQNKKYPREWLTYYPECNYAVICGKISNNLVIIDFDFEDKPYHENIIKKLHINFPEVTNTLICSTPHGLHIYFYIDGDVPKRRTQLESPFEELKAIDILGEGGYALVPPSLTDDGIYMEVLGEEPTTISRKYFNKIVDFYTYQEEDKIIEGCTDAKINLHKFREPFQDILTGKLNIEEISKKTHLDEFVYWKYLFIEGLHADYRPDELFPLLRLAQPSFDLEETIKQLKSRTNGPYTASGAGKAPMKYNTMRIYFPGYEIEEPLEDWLMISRQLQNEFELITMDDSLQLMVREGNIYTCKLNDFYQRLGDLLVEVGGGKAYSRKRQAILTYIQDSTRVSRNIFCYDKNLINFKNGYYDIDKSNFVSYEEDSSKVFCYEIPHNYEFYAHDCPKFRKYLLEWLGENNPVKINDIFEMIGYSMTMNTGFKKAFFIFGGGNAGKTQFQTVLEHVIGHDNRGQSSLQRLAKNEFGTDGLEFKLINMIGDMSDSSIEDLSAFKVLTGGDKYVGAEIKGGKKYQFRNITKIWYNANFIPKIVNQYDKAFYIRWILIHFPNIFPEDADGTIKGLGDEICKDSEEIQGIIHHAINGVKRLYERGYFRPEIVRNTEHLWRYSSDEIYAFLYDNCIRDPNGYIEAVELQQEVNKYLHKKGRKQLSAFKLKAMLESEGIFKIRGSDDDRLYYYEGVTWKPESTEVKFREFNNEGDIDQNIGI